MQRNAQGYCSGGATTPLGLADGQLDHTSPPTPPPSWTGIVISFRNFHSWTLHIHGHCLKSMLVSLNIKSWGWNRIFCNVRQRSKFLYHVTRCYNVTWNGVQYHRDRCKSMYLIRGWQIRLPSGLFFWQSFQPREVPVQSFQPRDETASVPGLFSHCCYYRISVHDLYICLFW